MAITTVSGSVWDASENSIFISVKDEGALGDGSTDDSTSFQNAIDKAFNAGGGIVRVSASTNNYVLGSPISLKKGVVLQGEGREASVLQIGVNNALISNVGSIETAQNNTLLANANAGDKTVTLSAGKGANFSIGDWVLFLSNAVDPFISDSNSNLGEIARIKLVSGDTLTLEGPLKFDFLTADTAEVQIMTMLENVAIHDLGFINPDPPNFGSSFIEFGFCYKPSVKNCQFFNNKSNAIALQGCVGAEVISCKFIDLKSQTTTPTGFGYSVVEHGANVGYRMADCYSERVRHAYTTTNGKDIAGVTLLNGVPTGSVITNCIAMNPRAAGFDTHPEGHGITFVNCMTISSEREGYQLRSAFATLIGCSVHGATAEAFQFFKTYRAVADGCIAFRTNKGIDPETSDDARTLGAYLDQGSNTHLLGCLANEVGHHGFELDTNLDAINPVYENCQAIDIGKDGAGPVGFRVSSAQVTDVFLSGCIARDSAALMVHGFSASSANPKLIALGCYSQGNTSDPFDGNWDAIGGVNGNYHSYGEVTNVTIASDAIDVTSFRTNQIRVEGEGVAPDDLSTINGGTAGQELLLRRATQAITVKNAVGNIRVEGGVDFVLGSSFDLVRVVKIGTTWIATTHNV